MLWLPQGRDSVATIARGRFTVYHVQGRTWALSFRPSGTHSITRDVGLFNNPGAAKARAEKMVETSSFGSRARSRSRALFGSRANFVVQSVVLPRDRYTKRQAIAWVKRHGYAARKIHVTGSSIRFRQLNPALFDPKSFRLVRFGKGIFVIMGSRYS